MSIVHCLNWIIDAESSVCHLFCKCLYFVLFDCFCFGRKLHWPQTANPCHLVSLFLRFLSPSKKKNIVGWIFIFEKVFIHALIWMLNVIMILHSFQNNQKYSLKYLHFSYCSSESDAIPCWLILTAFLSIWIKTRKFLCKQ